MTVPDAFVSHLLELMDGLGHIAVRRMFGGAAIYNDGIVFALLQDETLYLKVDDTSRAAFEAEGLEPFTYETKNGLGEIASYYRAPERLLDDGEELRAWSLKAIAVARAKAIAKTKKARSKRASKKA